MELFCQRKIIDKVFDVHFIPLAPVLSETADSSPPVKEDFGLESVSNELPIMEPDVPSGFKSPASFMAPRAAKRPRGPENPQAKVKPRAKFPIPQAIKRPELSKHSDAETEPDKIKDPKAPAGFGITMDEPLNLDPKLALRQSNQTDKDVKKRILHLMEQCLYHTQDGNMVHVEEMAAKYQNTKQFRLAFIILKLEEIKLEMQYMWSYLKKNLDTYKWKWGVKRIKILQHLYYYTHMLKKNLDVTYAVEFLLEHFSEM